MDKEPKLFFIINKLIESKYTVKKLQKKLCDEFNLDKEPSRNFVNGCIEKIEKYGFKVNKDETEVSAKYYITKTPLNYNLNENEKHILKEVFETYSNNSTGLENFFNNIGTLLDFKIQDLIPVQDISNYKNKQIYLQVKSQLQKAINGYSGEVRKVTFEYSPLNKKDNTNWSMFPYKIKIDEKKTERVYVYNKIPNLPKYFNLSRIMSIPVIEDESISKDEIYKNIDHKNFRLYPPVSEAYHLCADETKTIEDIEKGTVIISTPFYTAFDLCQKVLKYGEYAEIIGHEESKEKMKQIISNMQDRYS